MNVLTFPSYLDKVLKPICNASPDNLALATFLSQQLVEWEIEAERADGEPIAPLVIDALEQVLDVLAA